MSFFVRANKAYERGDEVRAVIVLVEGLKRFPDDEEALDLFLRLYGLEVDSPGLEPDVIEVLERRADADDLLSVLVDNLRHRDLDRIADRLLQVGAERGLRYLAPPPEPAPDPPTRPVDETPPAEEFDPTPDADDVPEDARIAPADRTLQTTTLAAEYHTAEADEAGEAGEEEAFGPDTSDAERAPARESNAREEPRPRPSRRRLLLVAVFVIAGLGVAALAAMGWQRAQESATIGQVDEALARLDPLALEPTQGVLDQARARWPRSAAVADRARFLASVRGLADGEPGRPPSADESGESVGEAGADSPWLTSAQALEALDGGDREAALAWAVRGTRAFPDSEVARWTRARVDEARGELVVAQRQYAELLEGTPDYLPARLGMIRVAARQSDSGALAAALSGLEEKSPEHPYLRLAEVELEIGDALTPASTAGRSLSAADTFIEAVSFYARARAAELSAEAATERVERALALEPHLAAAQALRGVLAARRGDATGAAQAFSDAARVDGLSAAGRVDLQHVATRALTAMGRPDLAASFATPYPDLPALKGQVEPASPALRIPATSTDVEGGRVVGALLARAAWLFQEGHADAALALLRDLHSRDIAPAEATRQGRLWSRVAGLSVEGLDTPLDEDAEAALVAADAYFDGEFARASAAADHTADPVVARYAVLSLLTMREVGRALRVLDAVSASPLQAVELEGVRLRAYARLGRDHPRFVALYEALSSAQPTGVERLIDLGAAAFWQGRMKEATAHVDAALERMPTHREANWLKGLILRSRGKNDEAEPFLRRSGRDFDSSDGILLELAYVSLQLGHYGQAADMFYKLLLGDRGSMEAIRGLGRALTAGRSATAERDLERIAQGYPTTSAYSAPRGEAFKWLAVARGIRKGREEGLAMLQMARESVGDRPDVLVEEARYHEARDEQGRARELFAEALQRNTTLAEAHLGLGRVALATGDPALARDHLQKYLELEPEGEGASFARENLKTLASP